MDAYKVAKAMTPFTADDKCRTRQQKDLLAYVRELTTRMPELNDFRNYRQHDFDVRLLNLCEPTPTDGDRNTHTPTKAREDLATVIALTVKGNTAGIVQDAEDTIDGITTFGKLSRQSVPRARRRARRPPRE